MIPKKIHYCWFGRGKKPKLAEKCIASWKKFCPDYELIEWNEDNYDVYTNAYTKYCYENKKWAFLSDYVRLDIIRQYGGIYFDTDVEVIKSFDDLLFYDAFYGFESREIINSGLGFGSVAHHITIEMMCKEYDVFENYEKDIVPVGCPTLNTKALVKLGLQLNGKKQNISGILFLPRECLNPLQDATGKMYKTEDTYSIHWYAKSALDKKTIVRSKVTRPIHRLFGEDCFYKIKKVIKGK